MHTQARHRPLVFDLRTHETPPHIKGTSGFISIGNKKQLMENGWMNSGRRKSPVTNDPETKLGEASRSSGHVTPSQKRWQQPGSAQESRKCRLIWVMLSFSTLVFVSAFLDGRCLPASDFLCRPQENVHHHCCCRSELLLLGRTCLFQVFYRTVLCCGAEK